MVERKAIEIKVRGLKPISIVLYFRPSKLSYLVPVLELHIFWHLSFWKSLDWICLLEKKKVTRMKMKLLKYWKKFSSMKANIVSKFIQISSIAFPIHRSNMPVPPWSLLRYLLGPGGSPPNPGSNLRISFVSIMVPILRTKKNDFFRKNFETFGF